MFPNFINHLVRFLIFFCILNYGCGNTEKGKHTTINQNTADTASDQIIEQQIAEEVKGDVIEVDHKTVVFFMPSKKEIQELYHEVGESYRWEAESLFNNFIKQANDLQILIRKQNIKCLVSTGKKFEIKLDSGKVITFDRITQDQLIGQILTDGKQEPVIDFGMYKNSELVSLIQDFFKIQNLGYVAPDTINMENENQTPNDDEAP